MQDAGWIAGGRALNKYPEDSLTSYIPIIVHSTRASRSKFTIDIMVISDTVENWRGLSRSVELLTAGDCPDCHRQEELPLAIRSMGPPFGQRRLSQCWALLAAGAVCSMLLMESLMHLVTRYISSVPASPAMTYGCSGVVCAITFGCKLASQSESESPSLAFRCRGHVRVRAFVRPT